MQAVIGMALMSNYRPSFEFRPWDGEARKISDVWTLRKKEHLADCDLWTHPIGAEARVTVDGELLRSEAKRDGLTVVDLALDWKQQFHEKGWK
jgi:hypothetical protein